MMASVFWKGVLLGGYLEKGHTITGAYWADLLRQLREKIKMKKELSGRRFDNNDEVIAAVDYCLKVQDTDFYKEVICMLHDCWAKCKYRRGQFWKMCQVF